jgi:hypothetical protein
MWASPGEPAGVDELSTRCSEAVIYAPNARVDGSLEEPRRSLAPLLCVGIDLRRGDQVFGVRLLAERDLAPSLPNRA